MGYDANTYLPTAEALKVVFQSKGIYGGLHSLRLLHSMGRNAWPQKAGTWGGSFRGPSTDVEVAREKAEEAEKIQEICIFVDCLWRAVKSW